MLGNTALKRVERLEKKHGIDNCVFAKVENTNPSGSIKDRAVYQMLLGYFERNVLKEGATVIEATSGNTGIALAYFQKEFKIKVIIVMPMSMSKERREMIAKYGAELVLVDGGMAEANKKAQELKEQIAGSIIFGQFDNADNVLAHYLHTGPEIFNELEKVDYVFAGIGTGGTATGIGRFIKDNNLNTKIIGVEPYESPLLTKGFAGKHKIQGIGANFVPSILRKEYIYDITTCVSDDAIKMAYEIRNEEGIDCGISSGAALNACLNYLKEHDIHGKNVVVIFPDRGDRYSW